MAQRATAVSKNKLQFKGIINSDSNMKENNKDKEKNTEKNIKLFPLLIIRGLFAENNILCLC
jgi:hypothetical protein